MENNTKEIEISLIGDPKELNDELNLMNTLNIVSYKITSKDTFTLQFTDDFLTFTKVFKDKLVENSKLTTIELVKRFPGRDFDMNELTTIFYTTVLYDYIISTKQDNKVDINNENVMGGLVARFEEINESVKRLKGEHGEGSVVN